MAAKNNPPADGVNVSPRAVATAKRITASNGNIHADRGIGPCALMQSRSPTVHEPKMRNHRRHSSLRKVDEIARNLDRTKMIQVIMTAPGKADKPFRLVGQRKEPFAERDGYRGIERAMQHE